MVMKLIKDHKDWLLICFGLGGLAELLIELNVFEHILWYQEAYTFISGFVGGAVFQIAYDRKEKRDAYINRNNTT